MSGLINKIFAEKEQPQALVTFVRERINISTDATPYALELHLADNTMLSKVLEEICTMGHFPIDATVTWEIKVRARIHGAVVATIRCVDDKGAQYDLIVDDFPVSSLEALHLEGVAVRS